MFTIFHKYLTIVCLCSLFPLFTSVLSASDIEGQKGQLSFSLSDQIRASKIVSDVSDSVVVTQTNLVSNDSYTYITGTILNDSRAGIYDLEAIVVYRDSNGRTIKEDVVRSYSLTAIGYPATVYGYDYSDAKRVPNLYDHFHIDFIPPTDKGYFRARVEIPSNADLERSEMNLLWSWTLRASLLKATATDIRFPVEDDSNYYDNQTNFGILFSGEWGTDDGITDLEVYLIGIGTDDIVSNIKSFTFGDDIYYPSDQTDSSTPLLPNALVRFDDISDEVSTESVELRISYKFSGRQPYPDSDIAFLSVRDTVFLPSDTIRVLSELDSTRVSHLKQGDLNEDGFINIEDLIILGNNFGSEVK